MQWCSAQAPQVINVTENQRSPLPLGALGEGGRVKRGRVRGAGRPILFPSPALAMLARPLPEGEGTGVWTFVRLHGPKIEGKAEVK